MLRFKKALSVPDQKETGINITYHKTHDMRRLSIEPKDNGYGISAEFEPKKTGRTDRTSKSLTAEGLSYSDSHPRTETVHEHIDSAMQEIHSHLAAHHAKNATSSEGKAKSLTGTKAMKTSVKY